MEINPIQLDQIATELLGTPYKDFGRTKESGLDCFGLVQCVYKGFGIILRDVLSYNYPEWYRDKDLISDNSKEFVPVAHPVPGDIISLRLLDSAIPNHLVVVLPFRRVLNVDKFVGVHCLRFFTISNKIYKIYRHKSIVVVNDKID